MARIRQTLVGTAAAAVGIVIAAAVLVLGEISVRIFANVNIQGNSSNLITPNRFNGRTWGNTPNVIARSFEATVYTDRDGFRIPNAGYKYPAPASERILILGDSVAFGPSIAEPNTFVGLLRAAKPDWALYNSSVIGYDTGNEADVVNELIARQPNFSRVILVYCLNDTSRASASNLYSLKRVPASAGNGPRRELGVTPDNSPANVSEKFKQIPLILKLNDYLREHSKLYLYLKDISTDPGQRYFLADYAAYRDPAALPALENLEVIASILRQREIPFTVIICPYEYQLRSNTTLPDALKGDIFLPQHVVTEYLRNREIAYLDATTAFERADASNKSKLFLRFDPMHLSAAGHRVMYDVISAVVATRVAPVH